MEDTVRQLQAAGICTELLCGQDASGAERVGIRLRAFGKTLPKNKMVLAAGATFAEAVGEAIDKAYAGRWETTDWAKRPWPVKERTTYGGGFGL